jgi:hypothetical protein
LTRLEDLLAEVARLTDAEQYYLQAWLAGGERWYLYCLGLTDSEIGPSFDAIGDRPTTLGKTDYRASDSLRKTFRSLRQLNAEEFNAFRRWFFFGNRSALRSLGVSDDTIGSLRIIPDDIMQFDDDYATVRDGTVDFGDGGEAAQLFIGGRWRRFG